MASEIDPSLRGSVDYDFFEASSPPKAPLKELREVETVEHKAEDSPTKIISVDITTTTKIVEKSDEISIECDDELSKDESSHSDTTRSRSRSHSSQSSRSSRSSSTSSYSSSESSRSRSRSSSRSQQSQSSSNSAKYPSSVQSQSRSITPQLTSSKSEVVSSEKLSAVQSVINTDEDLLQPPGKAVRRNTYDVVEVPLVKEEEPEQYIKNGVETKVSDSDSSGTESDSTDSDMTDVSPLASPDVSPTQSPRHSTKKKDKKARSRKKSSDSSKNGEKPIELESENVLQTEQTELKLLMEAVLELDGEQISPNRRVVFEPQNAQRSQQSNYSFSNDRRREIDQENERLLRNIARPKKSTKTGTKIYPDPPFKRLSHSAVNRQREQRKIEDENYKILKRLQKIKPTKQISRDQTLSEYQNRMCGLPFPISQSTITDEQPKNTLNIPLSQSHRTRSLYSIRSIGSANSMRSNTRNAISARKRGDYKPQWDDRW